MLENAYEMGEKDIIDYKLKKKFNILGILGIYFFYKPPLDNLCIETKKIVLSKISSDRIKIALEILREFAIKNKLSDLENEVIVILGRLTRIDKERMRGALSDSDYNVTLNRIISDIMSLLASDFFPC